MKKIISVLICIIMSFGVYVLPGGVASAAAPSGTYGTDYIKYGDVDINQTVDVIDALYTLKQSVNSSTLNAQKKGPADVDQNAGIDSVDALQILQFAVETRTAFTEEYIIDKIGGGTNLASCDGIPDKYQKKITFAISNGKWSDNTTANKIQYKTLTASGRYSTSGSCSLSAPTGMQRNYGYNNGAWSTTVPTTISGATAVTYTYSFSRMSVNYTVQHFRPATNGGSYSSTPTETETKSGYVNDTVSATAKSYTGYSLDSSKSTSSVQLKEETSNNVLKMYYGVASSNYITSYSKSNVNNGAYTKDTTADTSFSANINSLKPYTYYYITKAALNDGLTNPYDYQRLVYCLQGLINRDFGMDNKHNTLVFCNTWDSTGADTNWNSYIRGNGSIMKASSASGIGDGLTQVNLTTWSALYAEFKDVIKACGIVLWDGNVPSTANIALTICGVTGYLPVLANSPLHTALVNDGVTVKLSLVDRFKNGQNGTAIWGSSQGSTGSAKSDSYIWAIEKYLNRCSANYLAYTLDGAAFIKGYSAYADNAVANKINNWGARFTSIHNYDYFVARRMFVFDLDPVKDEKACDDPAQQNGQVSAGADYYVMENLFQRRYNRANGGFGQLMGFPPWWCKYSTDAGSGVGTKAATFVEWLFAEMITCFNMAKEADAAGTASMTNGSVFYKWVPKKSSYTNSTGAENISYNSNTYYYTFYIGDYDSSAWLKNAVYSYFNDSKLGSVAMMWSINPNLCYRVPMAFDYMYEKKTAKDYFAGGDGGAGYIIPEGLFHDRELAYYKQYRPSGNADAGTVFANYSKPLYQRFGMEMTGFIINGGQPSLTQNIVNCISQYSPKLNFTNCSQTPLVKNSNTYFVYCQNGVEKNQSEVMYNHMMSIKNQGYNFTAYRTVTLSPTTINTMVSDYQTYAASKGLTVKYVDPYTYYNLIKSSGQGRSVNATETLIESFDAAGNFTGNFSTRLANEQNKTEGTGSLWAKFDDVTGSINNTDIGGMVTRVYSSPKDLSGYTSISFDYWISNAINGSGALQVNFVTNGQDDGFNFLINLDNTQPGWHTVRLNRANPSVTTNGANWSSIRAIRFTFFNYAKNTSPDFMMFDNMKGISY